MCYTTIKGNSLRKEGAGYEKPFFSVRHIIGDILLAVAILLTADVVIVMCRKLRGVVLKNDYRSVFIYELILCAVLLLFALDVRFGMFTLWQSGAARAVGWVLRIVTALLTAVTVFFCGKGTVGGSVSTARQADHVIVLGLALENGSPTEDLLERLHTAQTYLEKHPEAQLFLTGGNADASGRTEADVMHDILAERGVKDDRMILEDRAKTTKENFLNIAEMIDPKQPVVLISSNYHMDRAVQTAKSAGFSDVLRLPAPSSFWSYGANVLSEVILELNELTMKK